MKIIAHRGASADAPENTLAAVALAERQGAHGVELDVRLSADGVPVMLHDATLRRVAGVSERVRHFSHADLARIDVGAWKGEAWRETFIPTLAQVLDACPPRLELFLELKEGPESVAPVLSVVRASGFPVHQLAFLSFHRTVLYGVHRQWPDVRLYLNVDRGPYEERPEWGSDPWTGIGWECPAPGAESVLRPYWERGKDGYVWTVDEVDVARALKATGCPRLITNRPGAMIHAFGSVS